MRKGGRRKNKYIELVKITGITGCVILALFVVLILVQLFRPEEKPVNKESSSPVQELPVTESRVVLMGLEGKKQATFYDVKRGEELILTMDGSTYIYDKYGQAMSLAQLDMGTILDISYQRSQKYLYSMQYAADAWVYTGIDNFSLNLQKEELTIGQAIYRLISGTKGFSGDMPVELSQINTGDLLTVRGVGQDVWCIRVDTGHGYLILENEEAFVGGWIEVGQNIIRSIEKDMRIPVPEGKYDVTISYRGYMDTRSVEIERNQDTYMDVSDLEETIIRRGKIFFHVTPSDAKVYIDGVLIDTSRLIEMEYGLHQLIAIADGYDTMTRYFRLEGESASLNVTLQVPEDKEETTESSTTAASESTGSTTTTESSKSTESTVATASSESIESSSATTESSESTESNATIASSESTESSTIIASSESTESSTTIASSEGTESSTTTAESNENTESSSTTTESSENVESSSTTESNESTDTSSSSPSQSL
ncbi:MAG: hypothetical protein IJ335_07765 [Lachnospiraceae bacterium]|nr:hypothetical protein [Lachnospiraceae bacterium]